ncbi:hypothetical protein CN689_14305 [Peribacillus butanolivorans]|uniref:Transcriptional regulator n=1 Tax=Peribacillus butanolivorans TaxID=421767 RepID=A0AAX0S3X2_9BACI|nr:hypothetical protein [Peribacillus butanolivorans]PEJ32297.1 hypothetical protein CN689_14305 [Peribacillus butanolivorans]
MNSIQKRVLHVLKEAEQMKSVSYIARKIGSKNEPSVAAELDLLNEEGYVNIVRSPSGKKISRAEITEKGVRYFYKGNESKSKEDIQNQLDELKETVELLNKALNSSSTEEKQGVLDKMDKIQSVLNGGAQLVGSIAKYL